MWDVLAINAVHLFSSFSCLFHYSREIFRLIYQMKSSCFIFKIRSRHYERRCWRLLWSIEKGWHPKGRLKTTNTSTVDWCVFFIDIVFRKGRKFFIYKRIFLVEIWRKKWKFLRTLFSFFFFFPFVWAGQKDFPVFFCLSFFKLVISVGKLSPLLWKREKKWQAEIRFFSFSSGWRERPPCTIEAHLTIWGTHFLPS